jgi:hypothetical protein
MCSSAGPNVEARTISIEQGRRPLIKRTLWCNGYEAEIFVDSKSGFPIYHYIVTREGMAEVIAWGQERSREAAETCAVQAMESCSGRAFSAAG